MRPHRSPPVHFCAPYSPTHLFPRPIFMTLSYQVINPLFHYMCPFPITFSYHVINPLFQCMSLPPRLITHVFLVCCPSCTHSLTLSHQRAIQRAIYYLKGIASGVDVYLTFSPNFPCARASSSPTPPSPSLRSSLPLVHFFHSFLRPSLPPSPHRLYSWKPFSLHPFC